MKESTILGLLLLLGGAGLAVYGIARRPDTSEIGTSTKAIPIYGCSTCSEAWSKIARSNNR